MIFVIFRLTKYLMNMKLTERLNVLIQAATLSQKSGVLTLDEAVKVKSAIDVISTGTLNQNFASAINILIEVAVSSQKKGAYSLKDAHMIYLAVDGMESEFQNTVSGVTRKENTPENTVLEHNPQNDEGVIIIPPKKLKKQS